MITYEKNIFKGSSYYFNSYRIFFCIFCKRRVRTADYNETKKNIDSYIDNQLEKIDLKEIQKYINDSSTIDDIDLKVFMKELIKGERNILDLFDKENIKMIFFDELKGSIKVSMTILVLALLSSILKSLDNSFSSNAVSQITTYIVFITMVSLTLIGFNSCT